MVVAEGGTKTKRRRRERQADAIEEAAEATSRWKEGRQAPFVFAAVVFAVFGWLYLGSRLLAIIS